MQLASVNLAPVTDGTAIGKLPQVGPVAVGRLGLAGDGVGSPKHHGGPDQAVYAYGAPDYDWWRDAGGLGALVQPGLFGDNLTISGLLSAELAVGDRLECEGGVVLEVTSARIPCATLARRVGAADFVRRFAAAERPGAYLRVLVTGEVRAGETVTLAPAADRSVSVLETQHLYYDTNAPPERLRTALAAPLAARTRTLFEERLARHTAKGPCA
jgi:MOSC domain-containing protein YiiM